MKYRSRNKTDLIIEVWELLDCESVGASEILAIEAAVRERFGPQAVASPMTIARMLADEGAVLRHPEIMALYIERAEDTPYDAAFRNLIETEGLADARRSIKRMENLRRKFVADRDKEGLRLLRLAAIEEKERLARGNPEQREMAEWFGIWLASPEIFENWIKLRQGSPEYISRFGEAGNLEK